MRFLFTTAILVFLSSPARAPIGRTVFVGDSITVAAGWPKRCANAVSVAQGSITTRALLKRIPEIVAAKPAHVVILAGVNDLVRGIPADESVRNIQAMADATRADVTVIRILPVTSAAPWPGFNARIDALNDRLSEITNVRLISLPPVSEKFYKGDGVHFRPGAYDLWQTIYRHRGLC